jgi:hypothetical protein
MRLAPKAYGVEVITGAFTVAGGLTTHGSAVAPLDVEGSVESLSLKGGVTTSGG